VTCDVHCASLGVQLTVFTSPFSYDATAVLGFGSFTSYNIPCVLSSMPSTLHRIMQLQSLVRTFPFSFPFSVTIKTSRQPHRRTWPASRLILIVTGALPVFSSFFPRTSRIHLRSHTCHSSLLLLSSATLHARVCFAATSLLPGRSSRLRSGRCLLMLCLTMRGSSNRSCAPTDGRVTLSAT
jgi:hypothetical protein